MRDIFETNEPHNPSPERERSGFKDIFMPVREVFLGATERVNARIARNNAKHVHDKASELLDAKGGETRIIPFHEHGQTYSIGLCRSEEGVNVSFTAPAGYDKSLTGRRFVFAYDGTGELTIATEISFDENGSELQERPLLTEGIFDDARTARVSLVATANILHNVE